MIRFPESKINIGLYVTGKRTDGFHSIESIFYPVPLHDALEIVPANSFSFHSYGLPIPGSVEQNLCVRTYHLLQKDFDLPGIAVHLLKHIPMGAGLGGGSSDGAGMLSLLNDFFHLNIQTGKLEEYAAILGSDCPFFIHHKPALVTGRGEIMENVALNLDSLYCTIVYPGISVSTAGAYRQIKISKAPADLKEVIKKPLSEWKHFIFNVFEEYAFNEYPVLKTIKDELYESGAIYAAMSGSGSALYALSAQPIKTKFPDYFVWQGKL